MMKTKELQVFSNAEFGQLRTVVIDGTPWMIGKDVAIALGYKDSKSAIADHVDSEDKQIIQRWQNAPFEIPNRGLTLINESGLYSLILSSKLPRRETVQAVGDKRSSSGDPPHGRVPREAEGIRKARASG